MAKIEQQLIEPYSKLELIARQVVEGFITGLHKSPFHGFSVEFAEHRLYNSGESTKHIDWKLYARTEKLFNKRYEEETNLRCQIVIDTSSSMYYPKIEKEKEWNKIKFSVYAAAALILLLKKQRDAFGLSLFNESLTTHTPCKSSTNHQKIIFNYLENCLNQTPAKQKTNATESLHLIAERIHKRSLVIIFSDMMEDINKNEELLAALQHLKHNKHEVILFYTIDKKHEIDFDFDNRPYQFIDMESGEEVKVNPQEIKAHYQQQIKQFEQSVKESCGRYGIDLIEADINKGFDQIFLPFLVKRNKMK